MTDEIWTYVESSEEPTPTEIEADIVRIRQNIRKTERPAEMEGEEPHIIWTYEERIMTRKEYEATEWISRSDAELGDAQTLTAAYELTLTMMAAGGE